LQLQVSEATALAQAFAAAVAATPQQVFKTTAAKANAQPSASAVQVRQPRQPPLTEQ
jgi:hypothetical protein